MRRTHALLLALLTLTAAAVAAQGAPPPTAPADEAAVPPEYRSARATMRTFLEAFYTDDGPDLETAASCLDLSQLPPSVRSLKARELAVKLKEVLDKTRLVDLEEVPDDPDRGRWVFARYSSGEIVLAPDDDGAWRFTPETVRDLGAIYTEVSPRQVASGVERTASAATPALLIRSKMPAGLRRPLLGLEGWQWLGVLLVILVGMIVGRVAGAFATTAIDRGLRRRAKGIDHVLLARAVQPAVVLVTVLVWGFGAVWIGLPVEVLRIYISAVEVVAVAAFVLTAYRLVDVVSAVLERRAAATETRFDDLLVPLVRKSLKVFTVAVGLVMILQSLQVEVAGLLAGLGLGGLAFALAAQDTVSNLFGSVTVLLDRPFQVGDWVVVGDVEGTVEEMGFRSTRIRTFYNSLITLPNSTLIKASVDNLGARRYRRWSTRLGIAYDTPPERVDAFCEGIRELVRRQPYTRKDYFHVYFNEFGAASLEVLVYVFFEAPDWATELRERHRLAVDILRLAAELEVEFAFPTQTLYLRRESWAPPEAAGDAYPEVRDRMVADARSRGERITRSGVGGEPPPPVSFDLGAAERVGGEDEV